MNCEEAEVKMMDFLDERLPQKEKEEMEKHLGTCERCMDEIRDFQSISQEISETKMEMPDNSLKINFYHMLHSEINKQKNSPVKKIRKIIPYTRIAAGLALLMAGTFLGILLSPVFKNNISTAELSQLRTEVQSMKELVMMNMLNEESPSERIKAVSYSEEIASPNDQVISALVKTLNTDKNVNVRMAAAYSLSKIANRRDVLDSLVKSLDRQTDPIIQVVLMDILVQKRETRALKPIQNIISNDGTNKEVKEIAKKNLQILL